VGKVKNIIWIFWSFHYRHLASHWPIQHSWSKLHIMQPIRVSKGTVHLIEWIWNWIKRTNILYAMKRFYYADNGILSMSQKIVPQNGWIFTIDCLVKQPAWMFCYGGRIKAKDWMLGKINTIKTDELKAVISDDNNHWKDMLSIDHLVTSTNISKRQFVVAAGTLWDYNN
jgi:hypothetical protein